MIELILVTNLAAILVTITYKLVTLIRFIED
jgi:hypothetical protein